MSTRFGVPILAVLLTVGSANLASAAYCGAANYCHCAWNAGMVMSTTGVDRRGCRRRRDRRSGCR